MNIIKKNEEKERKEIYEILVYLFCIYYWIEKFWFSNIGGEMIGNCVIVFGIF